MTTRSMYSDTIQPTSRTGPAVAWASSPSLRPAPRSRRAFTLMEMMVVIAIITGLAALLFVASKHVFATNKLSVAKAQLRQLGDAIRAYSDAWPAWKFGQVQVADKGYPDWSGRRLFDTARFNNIPEFSDHNTCVKMLQNVDDPAPSNDPALEELEIANECLSWCLTQPGNGGPFVKEDQFTSISLHSDDGDLYPTTGGPGVTRREITDPWGHNLRYFWVARSNKADNPSGFIAVTTINPSNSNNASDPNTPYYGKAVGWVLESPGPDGKYGNRWTDLPSPQQLRDAEDNIVEAP